MANRQFPSFATSRSVSRTNAGARSNSYSLRFHSHSHLQRSASCRQVFFPSDVPAKSLRYRARRHTNGRLARRVPTTDVMPLGRSELASEFRSGAALVEPLALAPQLPFILAQRLLRRSVLIGVRAIPVIPILGRVEVCGV
jgi:hypothetical protein